MKRTDIDLIPDVQNPTPDYYCTWQTQLYATNDGKPQGQRAVMGERGLFDEAKPYGWAYFYEQARRDLFLVMDDSWDVPPDNDLSYCGSLVLDKDKFPTFTAGASDNAEALKRLSDKIKALGWKGLGGWVCAQESSRVDGDLSQEDYWKKRLTEAEVAGFSYWKVDWGNNGCSFEFRKRLTDLGRIYAPHLIIEHAMINEIIPFGDAFRTYDVPAIMSIPMTMEKIASFAAVGEPTAGNACLLNCEDEAYISAACGFAMGIMRHPYSGAFVNGRKDMSFPEVHRNLKTKLYEIIRAVRWHRIAPAYAFSGSDLRLSETTLTDTWIFENTDEEIENWWLSNPAVGGYMKDGVLTKRAPAIIARHTSLPTVSTDECGRIPFVVACRHPNDAFAVATLGRTLGRDYLLPVCDVTVDADSAHLIGVFGRYKHLTIRTALTDVKQILMQDPADEAAFDVTARAIIRDGEITIPGDLIAEIGTRAQPLSDTSEPGVVIRLNA